MTNRNAVFGMPELFSHYGCLSDVELVPPRPAARQIAAHHRTEKPARRTRAEWPQRDHGHRRAPRATSSLSLRLRHRRLANERLGASEVGEQIPDVLVVNRVEQTFRHDGHAGRPDLGNLLSFQRDVLSVQSTQNYDLRVLFHEESR